VVHEYKSCACHGHQIYLSATSTPTVRCPGTPHNHAAHPCVRMLAHAVFLGLPCALLPCMREHVAQLKWCVHFLAGWRRGQGAGRKVKARRACDSLHLHQRWCKRSHAAKAACAAHACTCTSLTCMHAPASFACMHQPYLHACINLICVHAPASSAFVHHDQRWLHCPTAWGRCVCAAHATASPTRLHAPGTHIHCTHRGWR